MDKNYYFSGQVSPGHHYLNYGKIIKKIEKNDVITFVIDGARWGTSPWGKISFDFTTFQLDALKNIEDDPWAAASPLVKFEMDKQTAQRNSIRVIFGSYVPKMEKRDKK